MSQPTECNLLQINEYVKFYNTTNSDSYLTMLELHLNKFSLDIDMAISEVCINN